MFLLMKSGMVILHCKFHISMIMVDYWVTGFFWYIINFSYLHEHFTLVPSSNWRLKMTFKGNVRQCKPFPIVDMSTP